MSHREEFIVSPLADAIDALRRGLVVAYPTDTLYGLAADPRRADAVEAVFRIKGRSAGRALPLIAGDQAQASLVARLSPLGLRLAARFWPGPLTLVAAAAAELAGGVAAADGTVAVRVPDHAVARALARGFGFPVTATSANRSGEPPASRAGEVRAALGDAVAVLIDAGEAPGGPPSTIVDVTQPLPRLVRAGAVAWDRVLESLK